MKKGAEYSLSRDWLYVQVMAEEVRKIPRRPISTEQCASTAKNLARDPSEDEAWRNRPLNMSCQIAKSADDMAKYERKIDPELYSQVEATRRRPKNSAGQSELSSVGVDRRLAGISAFTCSPPAKLTEQERARISQIAPYTPPPPVPPKEKRSFLQRLFKRREEDQIDWSWVGIQKLLGPRE